MPRADQNKAQQNNDNNNAVVQFVEGKWEQAVFSIVSCLRHEPSGGGDGDLWREEQDGGGTTHRPSDRSW